MIQIICNSEAYTYNTYHMIKAFYPSAQAVCRVEEKASNYVTVLLEDGRKITVGAADMPSKLLVQGKRLRSNDRLM